MTDLPELTTHRRIRLTLANQITILRIILIPVTVILLIQQRMTGAFWLMLFSSLTDLADGLAARLRGEQTQLGAFLDPMADKLLLTSVFLTMTAMRMIDIWVFVVIFSRDLLIVLGWGVIYILTSSTKITPRPLGKVTTAIQMVVALLLILPMPNIMNQIFIWTLVLTCVASIVDYIVFTEKRLGQWN